MRTFFVISIGLFAGIALGGPWLVGVIAETEARTFWRELTQRQPQLQIHTLKIRRGWLTSTQHIELRLSKLPGQAVAKVIIDQQLRHGPVLFDRAKPLQKATTFASYLAAGSIDIVSASKNNPPQALPIIQFKGRKSLSGITTLASSAGKHRLTISHQQPLDVAWSSIRHHYQTASWRQPTSSRSETEIQQLTANTSTATLTTDKTRIRTHQQPDSNGLRGLDQLKLDIQKLRAQPTNGDPVISVGDITLRTDFFPTPKHQSVSGNLRLDMSDIAGYVSTGTKLTLKASFSQLSTTKLNLQKVIQWYQQHGGKDAKLAALKEKARATAESGLQLNIEQLSYRSDGETSEARAKLALLPASTLEDPEQQHWSQRAIATLSIDASKRTLYQLAAQPLFKRLAAQLKLQPDDTSSNASQSLSHFWLQQGWLYEEGNRLINFTELQSGELIINGKQKAN